MKYHIPLEPGCYYHLFNHSVGSELLFRCDDNYRYFLNKSKSHILPVANILAYTLMPNHFHLLIRIKSISEIAAYYKLKKLTSDNRHPSDFYTDFLMERFSNWCNSYTKAYNKMYARRGALFMDYLRRSKAENNSDLLAFIFYIHKNAVHHGISAHIGEWRYDSYKAILSDAATSVDRAFHQSLFGSDQNFVAFHQQPVSLKVKDIDSW